MTINIIFIIIRLAQKYTTITLHTKVNIALFSDLNNILRFLERTNY